jgi:DNA replicative helicase MCM subunit Mcm2 (Cdc46/Mcm family)
MEMSQVFRYESLTRRHSIALGFNSTRLTATANASCDLQDLPETVSPGETPESRLMMVERSLVYTIPPGSQVTVTAVYNIMKVCIPQGTLALLQMLV